MATRQDVARVVEMHDFLDAAEISVVPIGLCERRIGSLVDIAQRRHLEAAGDPRLQIAPSGVHR
jgi:hypothetical protein